MSGSSLRSGSRIRGGFFSLTMIQDTIKLNYINFSKRSTIIMQICITTLTSCINKCILISGSFRPLLPLNRSYQVTNIIKYM